MSPASLKRSPGGDVLALVQELAQLGPKLMLDLAPKLLGAVVATVRLLPVASTHAAEHDRGSGGESRQSRKEEEESANHRGDSKKLELRPGPRAGLRARPELPLR